MIHIFVDGGAAFATNTDFTTGGCLNRRLEKGRIQALNASIAPVIGWNGLKLEGVWGLYKYRVNLDDG